MARQAIGAPAHQLARGRARQRRRQLDPLRHLEAGQRLGAVAAQLVRGRRGAALEHDDRGHRLLPLGVLAADHGGVGDLGVAQQHLLDFGRDDVLAAADDHVVDPVLDVEEAFLVDAAEVAGVQPAVGVGAAGGDGRALDEDLAVAGCAGGWSAAAGRRSRACAWRRPGPASSPASRSRSGRRSGPRWRPWRSPLRSGSSGTGPPPTRIARGPERSAPASSSRVSIVVTSETTVIPSSSQRGARRGRRRSRRGRPRWCRR